MSLSLAKFRVPAWECNVCREVYLTEGEAACPASMTCAGRADTWLEAVRAALGEP